MLLSSSSFDDTMEDPFSVSDGLEVFLLYPSFSFVGVSSLAPSPYGLKDSAIYTLKGFLAYNVAIIVSPPRNNGVELFD